MGFFKSVKEKELLSKSKSGDTRAMLELYHLYADGDATLGIKQDSEKANKWAYEAYYRNDPEACYIVGVADIVYGNKDKNLAQINEGINDLKKAYEQGYVDAAEELNYHYLSEDDLMYDPAEGLKWGEEAGMRGNACSAWRLSIAYKSGDHSFPKDLTKAEYWGKIAIDNKAEDETHRHRYLENYANIECELGVYDDALNYYNQAAKLKDDGYIELMIGFVYEKQGNVQEALIHYEKAVSMGDKYSKDALVSLQLLKTNMQ